ncbi:universal stress protein [Hymenobacter siberiensis]|jgi:nucleotide-binding universal stress UspA family protein|uniref:universal stress protein n=1 Tax=Hymenobacter siberiensis TaxID=2848396 RepID=UPI001C1DE87A|nr:universal stress protein [Hymenobacter siberiensis]MBU6122518.1 universal stress protein [Hymenobacter siberiensis]
MQPNFVVLTDFSLAAERARVYAAALATPLKADLHLIHVFLPQPITTEYGTVLPVLDDQYVPATRRSLQQVAAALPVHATAELLEADWPSAIEQALHQHHPLLLVSGLTATSGYLDEWLSNRTLPLVHQTGFPLLLVPEYLPDAAMQPPRRVVLALEADQAFTLEPAATAVIPVLQALECEIIPMTVLPPGAPAGTGAGFAAAQACGLASATPGHELRPVLSELPASGVLQAVQELNADLLVLLDQGHGWMHKLVSGSVIDHVLRYTKVPVLLLSARPRE